MKKLYTLFSAALFLLAAGYASPFSHETGSAPSERVSIHPKAEGGKLVVHPPSGEGVLAVR